MSQPSSGASRERAPSLEDDERSPDIREHIKDYLAKLGFKSDPAVADMLSEYGERKLIAYRKTEGVASFILQAAWKSFYLTQRKLQSTTILSPNDQPRVFWYVSFTASEGHLKAYPNTEHP